MGVYKGSLAAHEFDVVECEVLQNALALHVDYFAFVVHEIVDGEIFLERVVDTVEAALLEAGKVERGFAKSLAGNGAGVDAASTHMLGALDDGNAFAKIRGLGAALFTSRAAANHDEIEGVARNHTNLPGNARQQRETRYPLNHTNSRGRCAPVRNIPPRL